MKKSFLTIIAIVGIIIIFQTCKKEKDEEGVDKQLFNETTAGGFTYYKGGTLLPGISPSPHGSFKLRFNATALSVIESDGELATGNSFPTGSILVKEVHSGNTPSLYAVMKKDPSNENAGSDWLWAEYNTDGTVVFSTGKKGEGCIGCHSGTPNRDLSRTFDLH